MAASKNSMSLPPALLRLERFWLESLRVQADLDWDPQTGPVEVVLVGGSEYRFSEDSRHFLIRLNVKSQGESGQRAPYGFEAAVAGEFSLAEDIPDDQRDRMVRINGTAILYGIARGVLATVTGMGLHGPVHLPSINFVGLLEPPTKPRKRATRPRQARSKVPTGET